MIQKQQPRGKAVQKKKSLIAKMLNIQIESVEHLCCWDRSVLIFLCFVECQQSERLLAVRRQKSHKTSKVRPPRWWYMYDGQLGFSNLQQDSNSSDDLEDSKMKMAAKVGVFFNFMNSLCILAGKSLQGEDEAEDEGRWVLFLVDIRQILVVPIEVTAWVDPVLGAGVGVCAHLEPPNTQRQD